jgi:hypothetical protein
VDTEADRSHVNNSLSSARVTGIRLKNYPTPTGYSATEGLMSAAEEVVKIRKSSS